MKKKLVILALILALAAGLYYYFQSRDKSGADGGLVSYGNVDIRDVALGFRVAGRLEKMIFEEGDRVKPGDLMAVLDKTPLEEQVAVSKAQVSEARAALDNAEKIFERRASLVKTGSVTVSDYDDALAARDQCKAKLATTLAQLSLAETNLADASLFAPSSGTVLTRVREPGSILAAGTVVYTVALDDPVWIRSYISEPDLGRVAPGQKVTVKTDSGGRYQGQIGFISPQAEFTPKTVETTQLRTDLVYRLRVIVDNPDKGLRQGMPVTVEF